MQAAVGKRARFLALCAPLFLVVALGSTVPAHAIVNGEFLTPNEDGSSPFPFFATLFFSDPKFTGPGRKHGFCGGALIGDRYVLTAAHCVDGNARKERFPEFDYSKHLRVRLGHVNRNPGNASAGTTGIVRTVDDIWLPPEWEGRGNRGNDFAVLVLSEPVEGIKPIKIGTVMPPLGTRILTLGHGVSRFHTGEEGDYRTTTDRTKIASMMYIGIDRCVEERRKLRARIEGVSVEDLVYDYDANDIHETVYCEFPESLSEEEQASGAIAPGSTCGGDSGGPHFYLDENNQLILIGVSSHGFSGCEGAKHQLRLPGDEPDDSPVAEWIKAVVDGKNPFIIGSTPGRLHRIDIRGPAGSARDFRGHAGRIVGRTAEQKSGAEDHLRLRWSGALTFGIENIDKIRVDGYYWELPRHFALAVPEVEIETGRFAVNGVLVANVNTEVLNRASEQDLYGFVYADKEADHDIWTKNPLDPDGRPGSIASQAGDSGSWYVSEHQVRNNPTLAGHGTVVGRVVINGGGLHAPGHRRCILLSSVRARLRNEMRCFNDDDIHEYAAHEEDLFGVFSIVRAPDDNDPEADLYTVREGGALLADIHPRGWHDRVHVSGGDADVDGTLIALFHDGDYGDLSWYPLITTDPDRDIERGWRELVLQGAAAYYDSDGDERALPPSLADFDIVRFRVRSAYTDNGRPDHTAAGLLLISRNSPFSSLNGPLAAALDGERSRLLALVDEPAGEDFREVTAAAAPAFLRMQPVLSGFSVETTRKLRQLHGNSSLAAASFVDGMIGRVMALRVHDRLDSALFPGEARENGREQADARNPGPQRKAMADLVRLLSEGGLPPAGPVATARRAGIAGGGALGSRLELGRNSSWVGEGLPVGGWSEVLHVRGAAEDGDERSIRYRGGGMVMGIDLAVAEAAVLGVMGGYLSGEFGHRVAGLPQRLGKHPGRGEFDHYGIGLYGGFRHEAFHLTSEVHYGHSGIKSIRPIDILLDRRQHACAEFEGNHWSGSLMGGWRFDLGSGREDETGRWSATTVAGARVSRQSYGRFRETGAGPFDARVEPNDQMTVVGSLGAELSYARQHTDHRLDLSLGALLDETLRRDDPRATLDRTSWLANGRIRTDDSLKGLGERTVLIDTSVRLTPAGNGSPSFALAYDARLLDGVEEHVVSARMSLAL